MSEPDWMDIARGYIGTEEIPGAEDSPVIKRWLILMSAWWRDDATPWCGVFVGAVLREAGIEYPPAYYRARAWLDWGVVLDRPRVGCVVVYERRGGGHVGFVVGRDRDLRLLTLGGNQRDAVNIMPFDPARAEGYRWPAEALAQLRLDPLPVLAWAGESSRAEA